MGVRAMQFKVGQAVKIIPSLNKNMTSEVGITDEMVKMAGKTCHIKDIIYLSGFGGYGLYMEENEFVWESWMLKPAALKTI